MRTVQSVVIAAGQSLSSSIDLGETGSLAGVIMSDVWTAAGYQVMGSVDGQNFYPMVDYQGSVVGQSSAAVNTMYATSIADSVAARYIKIQSGSAAAPVNQVAAATLTIISRKFN